MPENQSDDIHKSSIVWVFQEVLCSVLKIVVLADGDINEEAPLVFGHDEKKS